MDPLAGTPWSAPSTVAGFVKSEPNHVLLQYTATVAPSHAGVALDIGCGAGRNALPLASRGWRVVGTDLSWPMLEAARTRVPVDGDRPQVAFVLAPMHALPIRDDSVDLVIAHGIWNLAESDGQFRRAVAEAARVSRTGAALFVFTFSRHTLPDDAEPIPGQTCTFTQFSGRPQIFLSEDQLIDELGRVGFVLDTAVPITEYNRPAPNTLRAAGGAPVILEAAFRYRGPSSRSK